nr:MAG TPA: hypothetical protein [Inoviridae sp.]
MSSLFLIFLYVNLKSVIKNSFTEYSSQDFSKFILLRFRKDNASLLTQL